jgi:serine O-acetyltransferase
MSFRILLNYRIGHYLHQRRNILNNILIMWLKKRQLKSYASDIFYEAILGKNGWFPHPTGIVIGVGAVIEDNVKIWQNVTLGSDGQLDKKYPTIKINAKIYSNAQIIGEVIIGKNATVGASSVVIKDVPPNKTVVGIPAKIIN